jgi:FkbM family methyltransferase
MRSDDFWNYFDQIARPKLAQRVDAFSKVFSYLDGFDRPVTIVETSCVRERDSWDGDGQSTILFDKYAEFHPGSIVFSVDIDAAAAALCRSLVRPEVRIHTGDSVAFLKSLAENPPFLGESIDLLYLDSYHVNLQHPVSAATHALKELLVSLPLLSSETLVVVDDSPMSFLGLANPDRSITMIGAPRIGGKGQLISEFADQIGGKVCFHGYQCGWLGLGRPKAAPSRVASEQPSILAPSNRDGNKSRGARLPQIKMSELLLRMADALPEVDRRKLVLRLLGPDADEITFRRHGTRWTAFPWDGYISAQLFIDGTYQFPENRALLAWLARHDRFVEPRDVIVDVGANIGTSTIPFAQQTRCRVVAIEPVPEIFAVLCRNITDNCLETRVTCVQAAISLAGDRVRMIMPAVNGGGAEVSRPDRELSFAGLLPVRGVIDVPAVELSDLLNAHGVAPDRVSFVWSDTQGSEVEVIRSGSPLWAAGVPLFAEFDPTSWGGAQGRELLLAAATECFVGFTPAADLIAGPGAEPQPITELAAFIDKIGDVSTDVLLLPQTFEL